MLGNQKQLQRSNIQQDGASQWQLINIGDRTVGSDLPAERSQMGGESVGDLLGAAARQRPADGVAQHAEHKTKGGGRDFLQRQKRMGGQPGEKRAGGGVRKAAVRQAGGRTEGAPSEAGELKRMPRKMQQRS